MLCNLKQFFVAASILILGTISPFPHAYAVEPVLKVANPENNQEGQEPRKGVALESTTSKLKLPGWFENPSLVAGLKSFNDSGRLYQTQNTQPNAKSRVFKSMNEVFMGVRAQSGWGAFAQAVEYTENTKVNGTAQNATTAGDPSLTLTHPALYKSDTLSIGGQLRQYFQGSDYFIKKNVTETAYYLFLNYKMAHGYDLGNSFITRNFYEPTYSAADTSFVVEDYTSIAKQMNSWLRIGLGQHTQIERHWATAAGTCIELFPYADFMLARTIFVGPRVYLPGYTNGKVYDSPTAVSTNQIMGELYFQATL